MDGSRRSFFDTFIQSFAYFPIILQLYIYTLQRYTSCDILKSCLSAMDSSAEAENTLIDTNPELYLPPCDKCCLVGCEHISGMGPHCEATRSLNEAIHDLALCPGCLTVVCQCDPRAVIPTGMDTISTALSEVDLDHPALCPTCYSQCNGECRLKTNQTCTISGEQQVNDEQEPNDELQVKTSGVVEQVLDVDVVTTGDDSEGGFLQASDDSFYDNDTDQPVEKQVQNQQQVTDEVSCAILHYLNEL